MLLATLAESKVELYALPGGSLMYCNNLPYDETEFDGRRELILPPSIIYSGKFMHSSHEVISAHQDCRIRRWQASPTELRLMSEIKEHLDFVRHIEISQDDSLFVSINGL